MIAALILPTIISTCSSDTTQDSSVDTADVATVAAPQLSEEDIRQQEIKAESDRIIAEAQAEYEANHEAKLEPVDLPNLTEIETVTEQMKFEDCVVSQIMMESAIAPNYKTIDIVDTSVMTMKRFCTNDGSVLVSCFADENQMTTTKSPEKTGC